MATIKLLLADVDGTLVTKEKTLTARAIAAVQALRAQGIGFAITSGRPPRGMQMLLQPLEIDTPVAGFNGGMWVNPDLSPIEARTLPRDVAERAVKLLVEAGLDPWVYSGEDWLVHDKDAPHVSREAMDSESSSPKSPQSLAPRWTAQSKSLASATILRRWRRLNGRCRRHSGRVRPRRARSRITWTSPIRRPTRDSRSVTWRVGLDWIRRRLPQLEISRTTF